MLARAPALATLKSSTTVPLASWEWNDGSKFNATQLAIAPNGTGNILLQLVKANAAVGTGKMQGMNHIQRVAT